jgi:serine/threonine-protein kinase
VTSPDDTAPQRQLPDLFPGVGPAGSVIDGKFRLEFVIGAGGMGVVVAAHHVALDQRVALKFMRQEQMKNPDVVWRFGREAQAAVKLSNPHVARVMDVGMTPRGVPYIVMEYLEGEDVGHLLRREGPMSPEAAADIVIHSCHGLAEAHASGIVHRDIKPENLFLAVGKDGAKTLKLLDFGISKASSNGGLPSADADPSVTEAMLGTPLYMAPEQVAGTGSDERIDVWALGAVLFELVTGQTAYTAKTVGELAERIMTEPPRDLRSFRPDVPDDFVAIVLRCLARDREARFQNVAELAVALLPFAPNARHSAQKARAMLAATGVAADSLPRVPSLSPPSFATSARRTSTSSVTSTHVPEPARRKPGVLMLSVGAIIAIAIGVGLARRDRDETARDAQTPPPPPATTTTVPASAAASEAPAPPSAEAPPTASAAPSASTPRTARPRPAPGTPRPVTPDLEIRTAR